MTKGCSVCGGDGWVIDPSPDARAYNQCFCQRDSLTPDNEVPATSWAVWAWQAYRDGRLVEKDTR